MPRAIGRDVACHQVSAADISSDAHEQLSDRDSSVARIRSEAVTNRSSLTRSELGNHSCPSDAWDAERESRVAASGELVRNRKESDLLPNNATRSPNDKRENDKRRKAEDKRAKRADRKAGPGLSESPQLDTSEPLSLEPRPEPLRPLSHEPLSLEKRRLADNNGEAGPARQG